MAGRYLQARLRQAHRVLFPDSRIELLRLQQQFGYNAHALVGIAPETRIWSCPESQGAVSYNEFGKVWLVTGDPLASAENIAAVADSFLQASRAHGRVVGFMPATQRFARLSRRVGLRAIKVGAAPYFDLATWAPRGDRAKKARAGVNQARRAGVRVAIVDKVDEKLIRESSCLCKSWLSTRRSALKFGWLFSVDLFQHKERKKYFTARDATGKLVGFLAASPIPARDGATLRMCCVGQTPQMGPLIFSLSKFSSRSGATAPVCHAWHCADGEGRFYRSGRGKQPIAFDISSDCCRLFLDLLQLRRGETLQGQVRSQLVGK